MKIAEKQLKKLYEKVGSSICSNNDESSCWGQKDHHRDTIYLPYIGKNYDKYRILCLGINLNDYGDSLYAMRELTAFAVEKLKDGKKQLQGSSLVPHRTYTYAAIWLIKSGLFSNDILGDISNEILLKALDYIAITNTVKCSTEEKKGYPYFNMWNNCSENILLEELNILKPKRIILIGNSRNYNILQGFLSNVSELKLEGSCYYFTGELSGNQIEVLVVKHPASPGGSSWCICDDVCNLLDLKDDYSAIGDFISEIAPDIQYKLIRTEKRIEVRFKNYKNFWMEIWFREDGYDVYIVEYEVGKNRDKEFRPMQLNEFTAGNDNPYKKKLYYELDEPCYPFKEKQKLREKIIQLIETLQSDRDN